MRFFFELVTAHILRCIILIATSADANIINIVNHITNNSTDSRLVSRDYHVRNDMLVKALDKAESVVLRMQQFVRRDRFASQAFEMLVREIEGSLYELKIMSQRFPASKKLTNVILFGNTLFSVLKVVNQDLKKIYQQTSCSHILRTYVLFYAGLFSMFSVQGYPKFHEEEFEESVKQLENAFQYFGDVYTAMTVMNEIPCHFHDRLVAYQEGSKHLLEFLASYMKGPQLPVFEVNGLVLS